MKRLLAYLLIVLGFTISIQTKSYAPIIIDPDYPLNASVENQYRYSLQFLTDGDYSGAELNMGWKPKTNFSELVKKMVDNDLELLKNA